MHRLMYDRGRLLKAAAFGAVTASFFLWVLVSPESFADSRKGRMLTSAFGYYLLVPMCLTACLALAWGAGTKALGAHPAVEFTPSALRLSTLWGLYTIPWRDVVSAELVSVTGGPQLTVRHRAPTLTGTKKSRVVLGFTELHPDRAGELVAAIEQARTGAGVPASAAAPDAPEGTGFDPEAAIQRYLASRPANAAEVSPAPPAPVQPARPVFGRKVR